MPDRNKAEWERQNEIVCNLHKMCWPDNPTGKPETQHEWVSVRVWLYNRRKLRTGKTGQGR
jgi:hypothetical protein